MLRASVFPPAYRQRPDLPMSERHVDGLTLDRLTGGRVSPEGTV
jgi:hypothetical protein